MRLFLMRSMLYDDGLISNIRQYNYPCLPHKMERDREVSQRYPAVFYTFYELISAFIYFY